MRRTGRVILLFFFLLTAMLIMWMFQSWREEKAGEADVTLHNVYITGVSGSAVQMISDNREIFYESASQVTGQAVTGIADVILRQNKIVHIRKKPEEIQGKLLKMTDTTVTVEEYGEIPMEDSFVVYKLGEDGVVSGGAVSDLLIGETDLHFVAAGKKVCAVVIRQEMPTKIRVILKDNESGSYDTEKVTVTSDQNFQVNCNQEISYYKKGEKVVFDAREWRGTTKITADDGGKICLTDRKKKQGAPSYRGTIEIDKQGDYLHIINEVSLEEYLYSVVPSEMPSEYSEEALKAQAICARTYAIQQMKSHRLASLGAHVDDSVSFQVYNDLSEDEKSIRAVENTKGQVVTYKGRVASTYFYSTSCGCSEGTKDVWYTKKDRKYLPSGLLNETRDKINLSNEDDFRDFIDNPPKTVDSEQGWYRWQTKISEKEIQKSLENTIQSRIRANPTQIQVKGEDGIFRSQEITGVGKIEKIQILRRGKGGIVSLMEIQGSEATIRVYTEYNIRSLLIGTNTKITRKDKREVMGLAILPSGFFYIEKKEDGYVFCGGGYGHGVGMSQTGANTLAGQGKSAEEIISFYFPGTSLQLG